MQNVIIIGCDGYIGTALTQRLLNLNYNVLGVDNLSRRFFFFFQHRRSATPMLTMMDKTQVFSQSL